MKKNTRKIFTILVLLTSIATLITFVLGIFVKENDKRFKIDLEAFDRLYAYQRILLESEIPKSKISERKFVFVVV